MIRGHNCPLNLTQTETGEYLPPLPKDATMGAKIKRFFREITLVSGNHTSCSLYFRSNASINFERKRHITSKYWYIIHPFSDFRSFWEVVMCIVYFVLLISVPLDVAFNKYSHEEVRHPLKTSALITSFFNFFCIINIILTFITGVEHYATKRIILIPWTICKQYISSYFIFDFLASLPADLILYLTALIFTSYTQSWIGFYLEILYLGRIFRLGTMIRYMDRIAERFNFDDTPYRVGRLLIVFSLIVHWVGCIMYIIPRTANTFSNYERDNWIKRAKNFTLPEENPVFKMYLYSIWRSMSHIIGAGHSLHYSQAMEDLIVGPIVIILGSFYVTYIFGIQIILSRRASRIKYLEIMNQLQEYMRHKQLPLKMQHRLNSYYNYRFQKKYFRENAITDTLSSRLRQEIALYCCRRLVENVKIFENLPRDVLGAIVDSLKPEVFLPNDILIKAGSTGDCMYFLASGTVAVFTANGKEVCHLEDGAYFGEIALLMPDQRRIATVIAIEICDMYRLDRRNFRRCFATNTQLYEDIERNALARMQQTLLAEEKQRLDILERSHTPWQQKYGNISRKSTFSSFFTNWCKKF